MDKKLREEIKSKNIELVKTNGYRFLEWLPILESPKMRNLEEIKGRMSVMNALIEISFNAPIYIISDWIDEHNLRKHLSPWEKEILSKQNEDLSDLESNSLRWYLEGLWALMWAVKMIDELDEKSWCGDNMASMLPILQQNENNKKIENIESLRSEEEIYKMLDYYYRVHWHFVDERIKDRSEPASEGIVYERRKALEWIMNKEWGWDDVELHT